MLISHILESLNEALELLHRQNSSSSSPTISRDSLSSNRSESPPFSFHKQQSAEAVAMNNNALPPPQQANHSSSCSCSCRRRCSRMAASVQELTNIRKSFILIVVSLQSLTANLLSFSFRSKLHS